MPHESSVSLIAAFDTTHYRLPFTQSFIVTRYGKKEKLQLTETPKPAPQANEVLIEVYAAGVNQLYFK